MKSNYGLLSVQDPRARDVTRITVDGRDVLQNKIVACDDRQGWAVGYKRDAEGRCHLNAAKTALEMELLVGDIEVTL